MERYKVWRGCSLFTHLFYYTRLGNKVALYFTLFTLFHTFYFISHFSTFPLSCFRSSLWRCRGRMVFERGGSSNRSGKPFIPRLVKRQFSHCSSSMTFYSVCSLPPSSAVASRLSPLLLFFSPLVSPSVTEILWWLYFVILVSFSILDPPSTHGGQSCFETWWFFAFLSNSGCWCLQQSPNCFLPRPVVSWVCPAWPCTCQGSQVKINTLGVNLVCLPLELWMLMSSTVLKLSSLQARSVLSSSSSADDDLALVRGHRGEDLLGHAGATASVLQLNSHSNKCMLSPKNYQQAWFFVWYSKAL